MSGNDEVMTELREAPAARLDEVPICRALDDPVSFRADGNNDGGDTDTDDADTDDTDSNGSPGTMFGHFSTFNTWYEVDSWFEGHFLERVAPGAFKRTIKNRSGQTPVRVLLDHGFDPQLGDKPLGVPEILEERDIGPYAEVPLFRGVPVILVEGLRQGAYGQSFRFEVMRDLWIEDPEAKGFEEVDKPAWAALPQRTIQEVRLHEFGPTPFPANPAADAGLRSTTDEFMDRLARRNPEAYASMVARAKDLRTSQAVIDLGGTGGEPAKAGKQQDQRKHSEDSPSSTPPDSPTETTTPVANARAQTKTERNPVMPVELEPMTAEERSARVDEIRTRLTEIDQEFDGAALPGEIQTEWDQLNEEMDAQENAIHADRSRKERIAALASRQTGEEVPPGGVTWTRGTGAGGNGSGPGVHRRPDNIYDLHAIRQEARSVEELPALYRRNALRAVEQMRIPSTLVKREDAQENIARLLEFVDDENATLARRVLVTMNPTYQRAFGKMAIAQGTMGLTTEEQRALSLGTPGSGGFAVPVQLDPTIILTTAGVINPLRRIARVEQIVGKEWQGLTSAGITVTRAAEAAEATDDAPTLAQPTVKAERVQGFVPFSIEIDQDWSALQSEMTRLLADAKDTEEATSFMTGSGVSPQANGFLVTLNASSDIVANTYNLPAVYGLETALGARFRPGARFLASKTVYSQIRQLDTTGGSTLWERIGAGQPAELLGYPAEEMSTMPATVTTPALNDRWLAFGNFQNFLIVDRVGMDVDLIPHLFGANRRPTGQRGLFALWRNNSKVLVDNAFRILKRTT